MSKVARGGEWSRMTRIFMLGVMTLTLGAGCTTSQLRFTTLRLTTTIPDLQKRQVLDNFLGMSADPSALPYFSVVTAGTATINDFGSANLSFLGAHKLFTQGTYGPFNAGRTVNTNWSINPVSNPDRLRAMRAAYDMVLRPDAVDPADARKLQEILKVTKNDPAIEPGWVYIGRKHDVPKEACLVAHHGKQYVWVMPEHAKDFNDFVLQILNIATYVPPLTGAAPATPAVQPRALAPHESEIAPRLYEDSQGINRGLFFVPR
jgi:hypothetical protein